MAITIKLKKKFQRKQDLEYFLKIDIKFLKEIIFLTLAGIIILIILFCLRYGRNEIGFSAMPYIILKGGLSYVKGNNELEKGNLKNAEKLCLKGLILNPNNILNALCLAKVYKAHKNQKKSFVWYQWITYKYKNFAAGHLEIGKHFFKLKKYKTALNEFLLAQANAPWIKDNYFYLGLVYESLNMQINALDIYDEGYYKIYVEDKSITKKLNERKKYLEKKLFKPREK